MVFGLAHPLLFASLLVQAEPAPAPGPAGSPAIPAAPAAPLADPDPLPPAFFIGLAIGGSHRLAPAGKQMPPAFGMSVATLLGRQYRTLTIGSLVADLGAAIHFDYQRYARGVNVPIGRSGQESTFEGVRTVSYYDFVALQTAALPLGRLRLLLAAGVGLAIGYFSTLEPALRPGEARMVRPLVRASGGGDVELGPGDGHLGLTVSMAAVLREPSFSTAQGERLQVFGDRLSATLTYAYTF
jgi:hypothetical protein